MTEIERVHTTGGESARLRGLRAELRPTLALAWPVIAAEVGWMGMGIIDTIMVGRLGAEAIGAVSVGSILFFTVALFGMGLLLGMDPMVSQAYGAGRFADCHRTLVHGIYLSALLTLPLMGLVSATLPWMASWGIHPSVLREAIPYIRAVTWGTAPLLLYSALRRYLQAIGLVKPVMVALLSANAVNLAGNWILVYGHLGMPALGVVGSGWATTLARAYLASFLLVVLILHAHGQETGLFRVPLGLEPARLRRLLALGLPASVQVTLEVAVIAVVTMLAARFEPASLAAHQIVLNIASLTFMVPLGVAAAGSVRVGHAIGRRNPQEAIHAGWAALSIGAGFMACSGLTMVLCARPIMLLFTNEREVISIGLSLLVVAAVFQVFDGLQVVATGVLRGTGETRTPMVLNTAAHWCLGLPVGYALGFRFRWGVLGLWTGLLVGLIAAGLILLRVWFLKARSLEGQSVRTGEA